MSVEEWKREPDRKKREFEVVLEEYRVALLEYAEFMDQWRKRQKDAA